jgi:predicted CopG family antitoxin
MNTYEKGKAEGRAESEKMLFNWKLRYESVKKQAYEKGMADVISQLSGEKKITVEVLNEAKRQGGEKAVADFKAKLTRIKTFQKATEDNEEINYTKYCYIIEKAIKEAERK